MQFIQDNSIQNSTLSSYGLSYSTKAKPTLKLNSNSGIYNPSDNVFKIFTNNIDALTIDANQILTGNGSGLTNVNYDAITNKPDLSTTYSSILNLNNLSTNSTLSINNLNATSTTILNRLNSLNTSQWTTTGTTIFYNDGNVGIGTNAPAQKLDVSGNIKTQQLYINNPSSTASIFFSPNPSIYSIFSKKVPWAMYFAEDYNAVTKILPNYLSNGRDATGAGTITKTTASGNGAIGNITYISGGLSATLSFPTGSIPTNFTILSLTRYNGATRGRILQSQGGGNWLHGHRKLSCSSGIGKCYYDG